MQVPNLEISKQLYTEFKFWGPVTAFAWSVFKAINWIKDIKDNHLTHIQADINALSTKIDIGLNTQTEKIVQATSNNTSEVRGLRTDIQTLTSAMIARR